MATAEAALASLGPRYAPEDPTLPKPWKGLIDGSTGLLYYWNPETNVTQYERPAASAPPLPPGPPPVTPMPKLAPIPMARTLLSNGIMPQQLGQQMPHQLGQQMPQQSGQQVSLQQPEQQVPLQQTQQMPYQQTPQMASQLAQQTPQQQAQQYPHIQMQQMQYPQTSYLQGQILSRPQGQQLQGTQASYQQQLQPQAPQVPYQQLQEVQGHQQAQQAQESQTIHSQGQQSMGPQIMHQQGQQPHGSHSTHQQGQHSQDPQSANQLGQPSGFPRLDESGRQDGRQSGFSLPMVQQASVSSSHHHLQNATPHIHISPVGVPSVQQPEQIGGPSSISAQQTGAPSARLQQAGADSSYRQRQMGSPIVSNQMDLSTLRLPMGLKMRYEDNPHERLGSEFHPSSRNEGPMIPQQAKLAALPPVRNQQDMRMGPINSQFIAPGHSGGMNMAPGNTGLNMYNNAAFADVAPMRPSPRMLVPPDYTHISAADAYCQHHEVTALGDNVPAPFMTFEATGFPPEILREIHLAGFSSPTPIQAQTWPVALQSRDIVAIAKTGSGKTLGYLIPAFVHVKRCRNNPQFGPTVLVLAPTRELATQIQEEVVKFGRSSRVSCACLYGGASKGPQLKEIERGVDIVVATPGRLNDILEMKKINFRQVSFLVLDEADRMLDMGFEPQIRKIVNEIPPRRQTLMYTATWPKEVRKIAGDLLVNPVQVNIGSVDELAANKSITQYVEVVSPMDKQRRLEQILRAQERGSKIIIFCSTKRLCDQLAHSIGRTFGAAVIHGDKSQGERDHVLNQFRSGKAPILVATDVAARGLDIKDIRVVINYDFPTGIEDYVHRIGRTGRAGATGVSYTFFSDQDWKYAADLVKLLEGADQQVPPEVRQMAERGGPMFSRSRGGMSRLDSGGGRWDSGVGRGMRDGGGGFGGMRDGGGGFGGMRDGGGGFGGRVGRNEFHGGRGVRGRGFGGRGGPGGWGRHDRGPHDRYNNMDGRGRFDNRRRMGYRNRDRSYSRSPERVRTWGYDRSRSDSRSRSRSRSRSWSRSRSRSRSRSHSRSYDRPRGRNFSHPPIAASDFSQPPAASELVSHGYEGAAVSGTPLPGNMSPMSPGHDNSSYPVTELGDQVPDPDAGKLDFPVPSTIQEPGQQQAPDL